MTNQLPMEVLEIHADAQRRILHERVADFRERLQQARRQLQPKLLARDFLLPAAGLAALLALGLGYGVAAMFTRKH